MKGDEKQDMFAKLQQQQQNQSFHHLQHQPQFHHPFHVISAATRDGQTSEEADSHQSRSPTTPSTAIIKRESSTGGGGGGGGAPSSHDGATIEVVRRPRGRPPGSKNKPKPPVIITREAEPSMSPYVLELSANIDIVESVTRFCRKRGIGLCILNGSGAVTNVTLRQPSTTPGATVTFHGRFDILSLSATILANPTVGGNGGGGGAAAGGGSGGGATNGSIFTISLAGPQGQVFGGAVVGPLASAGIVYLIAATFNSPSFHRLPIEDEPRNSAVSGGGGNEGRHHSPAAESGGGGDGGHPPAGGDSCGISMYSCHLPSDVIWAPTARQPPPPY